MEYFCSSSGGSPCGGISDCNYREGGGGKQSNHRSDLSMKHDDYPQSRDLEDDKREGGREGGQANRHSVSLSMRTTIEEGDHS